MDETRFVAILQRHDSSKETKNVPVPDGQSLDFDEGAATRRWLWPHLGTEWHLMEFRPVAGRNVRLPACAICSSSSHPALR